MKDGSEFSETMKEPKWFFSKLARDSNQRLVNELYCQSCGGICRITRPLYDLPRECVNPDKRKKFSDIRRFLDQNGSVAQER